MEQSPLLPPPLPLRILNPHQYLEHKECVQGKIDKRIYDYLFRHLLAGNHGTKQALICFFFQRLYEAAIAAEIPPIYDESSSHQRLAEVANRLNFRDTDTELAAAYERGREEGYRTGVLSGTANLEGQPTRTPAPRPRRTNSPSPKSTA